MRMKKILLICLLVCAGMVQAGEYAYLVFTNTEGTQTALTVTNLTVTVNGAQLDVTNNEGTVHFSLTELASMQFRTEAGEWAAVENVLDGDAPVRVFSISGTSLGEFDNLVQAASSLGHGIYIISDGKRSVKININK